ncbi:MAG: DNA-binding protein [Lachnospiraceae bacterium]|nr:DNA-binding protein [Lachnospiraceae bacterium]
MSERYLLTFYEAAAYFGLGINRLRSMSKEPDCNYAVTTCNRKTMIIRPKLEEYINSHRYL